MPVASSLFSLLAQSFEGSCEQLGEGRHSRLDSHVFQSIQEVRLGAKPLLEERLVVERDVRIIVGEEGGELWQAAANPGEVDRSVDPWLRNGLFLGGEVGESEPGRHKRRAPHGAGGGQLLEVSNDRLAADAVDRKSTRLNSSHIAV